MSIQTMSTQTWRSVYLGWSLDDFNEARYALTRAGIGHCSGRRSCTHQDAPAGHRAAFERGECNKQYSLYVHKKDYDEAQFLVDNALHPLNIR